MNALSDIALYFDLDGTLIDSGPCAVISAQDAFRKFFGMELQGGLIIERMGIPIEVIFRELSGGRIDDGNETEVIGYFRERYRENSAHHTALFAGTLPFLAGIAPKTMQKLIVTSKKSTMARYNLENMGILTHFSHVIGSDSVEHYKPHPDPVYKARALLPSRPAVELVIGDADTDIIMGKGAGTLTCAVTWGAHGRARLAAANPDYIVDSFGELDAVISGLGAL